MSHRAASFTQADVARALRAAEQVALGKGAVEIGGGDARSVAEKFGNSIDRSSFLFKTHNPVDLEKVRQTDAARLEGRRRRNKS